ncbi:Mo-dependent nitrogenase C-terminal domain-containing protein [Scytonema millei]|uniref:Mo-dependent nitrogenase n=1 Tax=Scytonema millei VB511283 TaxID=1245923 RepID=A0A9X5E4L8_9CYAN|nr:Mo-dependent nitrogenase [Scytonema millei VB511283]
MIQVVNLISLVVEASISYKSRPSIALTLSPMKSLKQKLDTFEIAHPRVAKLIAKTIPAQCPFERDIILFGRKIGHIPPLCKLNPLYEQLVGLRFRALCYLADCCGEDIQAYC